MQCQLVPGGQCSGERGRDFRRAAKRCCSHLRRFHWGRCSNSREIRLDLFDCDHGWAEGLLRGLSRASGFHLCPGPTRALLLLGLSRGVDWRRRYSDRGLTCSYLRLRPIIEAALLRLERGQRGLGFVDLPLPLGFRVD